MGGDYDSVCWYTARDGEPRAIVKTRGDKVKRRSSESSKSVVEENKKRISKNYYANPENSAGARDRRRGRLHRAGNLNHCDGRRRELWKHSPVGACLLDAGHDCPAGDGCPARCDWRPGTRRGDPAAIRAQVSSLRIRCARYRGDRAGQRGLSNRKLARWSARYCAARRRESKRMGLASGPGRFRSAVVGTLPLDRAGPGGDGGDHGGGLLRNGDRRPSGSR